MENDFNWDEKPELNITPLVDIMLVLLAILMVTTPTITYQEQISLPKGSKTSKADEQKSLEIRMDAKKKIYIKNTVYDYNSFPDSLNLLAKQYDKNTSVYIRADKNLKYDNIVYLLKSIKEAGFLKVSLVTSD
ncbi:ExbD/TolR family protein [Helicobacter cappadocius]|uniref:Biopolymer transporter ExbD n=1 Tax=Helicobacter cappadocius TaxID=3063998 RepID=A0AA90PY16_9HELI|nr:MULTISPECIES: biopolymer transporter ExbD [unclassified Helicobacter]MDO7252755.1 biopolymer transporter ExbD [Helicobacter sp. faydin-H75]MDP2538623.1 biopolymer transporter ExbD [Helicobacter sp. faydin-H76]